MSARLKRYRLVCTDRGSRRCRWASRSWRSRSALDWPADVTRVARAHVRLMHRERDDIFGNPCEVRRWRPWLRWAGLLLSLAAAVLVVWQLALLARGGARVNELLWRWS